MTDIMFSDEAWSMVLSGKAVNISYLKDGRVETANCIRVGAELIDENGAEIRMDVGDLLSAGYIEADHGDADGEGE